MCYEYVHLCMDVPSDQNRIHAWGYVCTCIDIGIFNYVHVNMYAYLTHCSLNMSRQLNISEFHSGDRDSPCISRSLHSLAQILLNGTTV
jgi:hypothetical protein